VITELFWCSKNSPTPPAFVWFSSSVSGKLLVLFKICVVVAAECVVDGSDGSCMWKVELFGADVPCKNESMAFFFEETFLDNFLETFLETFLVIYSVIGRSLLPVSWEDDYFFYKTWLLEIDCLEIYFRRLC